MKSKFVHRPSSIHVAIISIHNARISFNKFWLWLSHTLGRLFYAFVKKIGIFFTNIFHFRYLMRPYMGAKFSKRYSNKSQPKVFKLLLSFFPNGPEKS